MSDDEPAVCALLGRIDPGRAAIFLDFDGVLVDIADRPDTVVIPTQLQDCLAGLQDRTQGALAIVTGRSATDLRRFLPYAPSLILASHGAERDVDGTCTPRITLDDPAAVLAIQALVDGFAGRDPGLLAERKPLGAVLHYRGAPGLGPELGPEMEGVAQEHPEFEMHRAKMAYEIRPKAAGKDRAVRDTMQTEPFKGKLPIYFGDDLTDEPALRWVADQGGIAVKVGPGESCATHRLVAPTLVTELLHRLASPDRAQQSRHNARVVR